MTKMTKEAAIKMLKDKKVYTNGKSAEIQRKLFDLGWAWADGSTEVRDIDAPFLFIWEDMRFAHSNKMQVFTNNVRPEIFAREIIGIEVTDPEETPGPPEDPDALKVSVTKDRILEAAKTSKEAEKALRELFPDVFEDNRVFCRVGELLKNRSTGAVYALIGWNGEVRVLNIRSNYFWKTKGLKVSELKDPVTITYSEFEKLLKDTGHRADNFGVIEL